MKLDTVKVGYLETNCYLLNLDSKVLVIDPGAEPEKIIEKIGAREVVGIIITHYHFDHIGALDALKTKYKCDVYDYSNLKAGKNIIKNFEFNCIYTPGHKEDLISVLFEKEHLLFCGDFIFQNSIGRCDLEGGNFNEMKKSIQKILKFEDNIIIYPGHGNYTTMGNERKYLESYI